MILRSRSRNRLALISLVAIAGVALTTQAQARTEQFRWTHPQPGDVQNYQAHIRFPDGSGSSVITLDSPSVDANGILSLTFEIGDGDKLISLRAIGPGGVQSVWTAPQLRTGPPSSGDGGSTGGGETVEEPGGEGSGGGTPDVTAVDAGVSTSPTSGAAQRYDFANNAPGTAIPNWLRTGANYSLSVDYSQFDIVALGGNHVLHSDSTDANAHAHAMGTDDSWSNYEVRGRMAVDSATAGIGVTAYSQFGTDDAYYRLGRAPNGAFMLQGRPDVSCTNASTDVTPVPGEWYRFKLYVQDLGGVNRISAKIWNERSAEPAAPQALCEDGSQGRLSEGRIGAWNGGGDGQKYWDDFEVILSEGGGSSDPLAAPVLIQIVPVQP